MGKRELLLIVVFLIAGVVVYQATVPPPRPGERSFSVGQIFEDVRRHVRGNRASAEVTTTTQHPADPALTELRLNLLRGDITITGEDRPTIEAELHVRSNGYDEAEAQRLARATVVKFDPTGTSLGATVVFPEAGQQRARLVLRVPKRLRVRIDPSGGRVEIANVASVELAGTRGEAQIHDVPGRVTDALHTGGSLTIANAGSVRLTTRGSDVRLDRIKADVTISLRAGELKASALGGPVEVDSNGTDVSLDTLDRTTGKMGVNAVNGSVTIKGLRTEGRIDSRNADVDVVVDRAAPLAIYCEGGGDVEITPPAGGYQLDAAARNAHILMPSDGAVPVTTSGQEQRATGPVHGGGPTITIRTSTGSITVRAR